MVPPPLPCTVLPCTEASDNDAPGLHSMQLVSSHHRELQTSVSTVADLISALANTGVGRIVLAPGTYILSAELNVTRSVVLEAAVAGSVVLNAQASSSSPRRVLNINPGPSGVVQVIGLNITGGYVDEGVPGALCSETCNYAIDGLCDDGGPGHEYNYDEYYDFSQRYRSTCDLGSDCTDCGPRGGWGGGVYATSGTVTITSSSIYGNSVQSTYGGGGGVYVYSGDVSIINSQIYSNSAPGFDHRIWGASAGVYVYSGTVTITSSSIYGNTASGGGGGVFVNSGTVSLTNSQVYSNQANSGGGVFIYGGTVSIIGSQIYSNTASGPCCASAGGGVYVSSGTVTIASSSIYGNTAIGGEGGGVSVYGDMVRISFSLIYGNTAAYGPNVYAGCAYMQ